MDFNYKIITILTITFFVAPIVLVFFKRNFGLKVNLNQITILINYSVIIQLLIGVLLFLLFIVSEDNLVHIVFSRKVHTTFSIATVWFGVIGLFFYTPGVLLLNIINWLVNRNKKNLKNNG